MGDGLEDVLMAYIDVENGCVLEKVSISAAGGVFYRCDCFLKSSTALLLFMRVIVSNVKIIRIVSPF